MNRFEYSHAGSLAEAVALLKEPGAVAKAGGVDLLERMKEGIVAPERLVHIGAIKGLAFIDEDQSGLKLGPLATMAMIEGSPLVKAKYGALASAASHVATPQIRNMATLGGNLAQRTRCWYFRSIDFNCRKKGGDTCFALAGENQFHAIMGNKLCAAVSPSTPATALIAYDAQVHLMGPNGERQIPVEQLFTAPEIDVKRENQLLPGELITYVFVPAPVPGLKVAYHKQGEKESFDWPIADCAVTLEMDGNTCKRAAIGLGALAPVPWRARNAEASLAGKAINEQSALAAAKVALTGATPLSLNQYKVPIFEVVIQRTILAAAGVSA